MLVNVVGDEVAYEEEDEEDGDEHKIWFMGVVQSGPKKRVQYFDCRSTLLLP